jgi:hypothetical protein
VLEGERIGIIHISLDNDTHAVSDAGRTNEVE